MAYTRRTWTNGSGLSMNDTNLNYFEAGLESAAREYVMGFRNISGLTVTTPGAKMGSGYSRTAGLMTLVPIFPEEDCTLDQITINIGTGTPSSSVRLGIYAADPATQRPTGTALVDSTVSGTTSGNKSITISQNLLGGRTYFLAAVAQGGVNADGAPMAVASPLGQFQDIGSLTAQDVGGYYIPLACSLSSVTGALPDVTGASFNRKVVSAWAIVGRLV